MRSVSTLLAILAILPALVHAQDVPAAAPNSGSITLDRLFEDPALNGPVARAPKFSPDGKLVTWLRPNERDFLRLDLWAAPVGGGAPFMGGDLYYVQVANPSAPRRLTRTPEFETDAQISPAGGYVSFIRDGQLIALKLGANEEVALSPAASDAISYGMAEFIAQEEMDRDTGYWWAPNDGRIVYTQVDESAVALVPRVEIGASQTEIVQQRYPRSGATNASVALFIRDLATGTVVPVDLGDNDDIYVARVNWSKDGQTLYVQRQNRAQTRLDLLMVDPATGQSKVILTEADLVWLNLTNDFTPLANGDFLWTSERTGWRHIERRKRDGTGVQVLTTGTWAVSQIAGVDEAAGRVFFMSNKDDSLEQRLYSASLAKRRAPSAVTGSGGNWGVAMATTGKAYLGTYSDPSTPPRLGLYEANGRLVRWIEENKLDDKHPWAPYLSKRAVWDVEWSFGRCSQLVIAIASQFRPQQEMASHRLCLWRTRRAGCPA